LSDLREAYQTLQLAKAKLILGFGAETDQVFAEFLTKRGFKIEGTYLIVPDFQT
jgi:hypothetical protein